MSAPDRSREPRTLPGDVTECPTCGATTDHDAEILYAIERITGWKADAERSRDAESVAVYEAGIQHYRDALKEAGTDLVVGRDELRAMVRELADALSGVTKWHATDRTLDLVRRARAMTGDAT